jgi:ATP-dependent exoDNAse (exonuclease V) beta subunit
MSLPADQDQRTRFTSEITHNFSVVASAGSGKTRAVTDRIISIATSAHALEWLPTLVVVTFTNRAADEMQQRARQRILEEGVALEVQEAFNRAFFGTIHSFCVKLLRQHGHHLGLPAMQELLSEDDDALWMEFVQQHTTIGASLDEAQRLCLLRLVAARDLMELGRSSGAVVGPASSLSAREAGFQPAPSSIGDRTGWKPAPHPAAKMAAPLLSAFPEFDFSEICAVTAKGNAARNVEASKVRLRAWETAWRTGDGYLPLPKRSSDAREFAAAWEQGLGPLRDWMRNAALCVAREVGREYRHFRIAKGAIRYDDQVALAGELFDHPEAARRIREKNYRVILDEAQDTDPSQFTVLLECTRPPDAPTAPPRAGHFCMVGDFQQAIWERADLAHYRSIHDRLIGDKAGEDVKFSVTFRLDRAHLDQVNTWFPRVLNGAADQVAFVPLNARPTVLPGQVVRCEIVVAPSSAEVVPAASSPPAPQRRGVCQNDLRRDAEATLSDWQRVQIEARQLAAWLRDQGLKRLRAHSWRDVAILCPRKGWLVPLRRALRNSGLDAQIHSERDIKGDSPAYAWFTALAVIMAEPRHGYEIAGVLREVFGISDHDLAMFAEGHGDRFQIATHTARTGLVPDTLNRLAETRARIVTLPLFTAMDELVRATQLRERLLSLPAEEYEALDSELDALLTQAATAEADGQTLAGFAGQQRAAFFTSREVRATDRDAVQLITSHKAKGCEWQAVVVPFFARGVRQRSPSYPRLVRDPRASAWVAALDGDDIDGVLKDALDLRCRQELERLLYVALTRPRHTLVLVDDRELFRTKKGELPKHCAAQLLLDPALDDLPTQPKECAKTAAWQRERTARRTAEQAVVPLELCPRDAAAIARERAAHFVKRNPSALAEAALADADPAAHFAMQRAPFSGPNAGQLYGNWWHAFIQRIDWSADFSSWDAVFEDALADSPDAALSQREWRLLRAQLEARSDFARLLTAPGTLAHAEMPLLWKMSDGECLEGVIDLAVLDPARDAWLIADWKTNRVATDGLPQLRDHYLPQLSAYWKAAGALLRTQVAAGIYSTATGEWLPYSDAELAAEWDRLAHAPALLAAVEVD